METDLPSMPAARVRCDPEGLAVAVEADEDALVVIRERWHPGWEAWSEGQRVDTFPVNQVHMGVVVPAGETTVQWRFRVPGMLPAGLLAGAVYAFCGVLLWRLRRRAV